MDRLLVISQIAIFVILVIAYGKLCTSRETPLWGKIAEIVSLYAVSFVAVLCNLKFIVWAAAIFVIGLIKILTTKQQKIERRI